MELCNFCIHREEEKCEETRNSDKKTSCYFYVMDMGVIEAYIDEVAVDKEK